VIAQFNWYAITRLDLSAAPPVTVDALGYVNFKVPEPALATVVMIGLAGLIGLRRLRRERE